MRESPARSQHPREITAFCRACCRQEVPCRGTIESGRCVCEAPSLLHGSDSRVRWTKAAVHLGIDVTAARATVPPQLAATSHRLPDEDCAPHAALVTAGRQIHPRGMGGWRVTAWDRVRARGTIRSAIGELHFDAAVAVVDDLRVGEEVGVTLVPRGATYDVTSVRPVDWRAPPSPAARAAMVPLLDAVCDAVRDRTLHLQGFADDTLRIAIASGTYEPERVLEFPDCVLVQMPTEVDDVVTVRGYAADEFARTCVEVAKHWPAFDAKYTVFRLQPRYFGQAAAYVVAQGLRIVGG